MLDAVTLFWLQSSLSDDMRAIKLCLNVQIGFQRRSETGVGTDAAATVYLLNNTRDQQLFFWMCSLL